MTTHCQTTARSGGGERQNLGAVNPFELKLKAKKGGGQLQTALIILRTEMLVSSG